MNTLTARQAGWLFAALAALMLLTRSHHFATPLHLPDATWAILFACGFYLSSWRWPALLAVAATLIDWAAISWGGVSSFCVSPAYALLYPAYAALWLGGRWLAGQPAGLRRLPGLVVSVVAAALVAELLSSGGFYFFSGAIATPTLAEFLPYFGRYFPQMLGNMSLYVALAALLQGGAVSLRAVHLRERRHG